MIDEVNKDAKLCVRCLENIPIEGIPYCYSCVLVLKGNAESADFQKQQNEMFKKAGIEIKPQSNSQSIFDNAVLLNLSCGRLGINRKVDTGILAIDADKDMLHLSKSILQSPELDAIKRHDGQTAKLISKYSLPSQFKKGIYLLPIRWVIDIDEVLTSRANERRELVLDFMRNYRTRVNEAVKLGSLYDLSEYPSEYKVEASFYFEYSFIECQTPAKLSSVSKAVFDKEREKAASQWTTARELGVQLLRASFADLVTHMVERLTPDATGKQKRFTKPLVSNLEEFCGELFDSKNSILGDSELSALVEKSKRLLSGVEASDLKDDGLRESVLSGFASIKSALDGMINTQSRRIKLDSDDAASGW
jgi:hypothetical protein